MPSLSSGHVTGGFSAATFRLCPCQLLQFPFSCLIFSIAHSFTFLTSHFCETSAIIFPPKIFNPCFKSRRPREEVEGDSGSEMGRPSFPSPSLSSLYKSEQQSECQNTKSQLGQRKEANNKMVTPVEHVSIPDDLPEFFKIYHPEICYPKLRIPPAFLKFFNGDIPSICVLEDLAARSWKVIVEKNDCGYFFMENWPDFVLENKLEFGDFLTFSYAGNSKFYIKIYGINGSLKQDVSAVKELALLPLVGENAHGKSIVVQPADQTVNGSGYLTASITSFEIVIKASHLRRVRLNFPATFGNRYLKRKQRPLVATLRTDSGSWTIVPQYYDRLELREGLQKFIDDNALRENDVCRFKLIDDEKFILKVRIMRYLK